MKIQELLSESENRFKTGVGNNTIPNPATFQKGSHAGLETWEGNPDNFNFRLLQSQYTSLKMILARNDSEFTYMGAAMYTGNNASNITRFVVISKSLIWEKYVGDSPGGAQNRVYVANQVIKTSEFLSFDPKQQDKLIKGNEPTPVDELLRKYFKFSNSYSYHNGIINVDGSCELIRKIDKIPVKFGTISGDFTCIDKNLTTLENSPKIIKGNFICQRNKIINLLHGPEYVGMSLMCDDNRLLQSLDGLPKNADHIMLTYSRTLPLLKLIFVEGLSSLYLTFDHSTENISDADSVYEILFKYLGKGRKGAIQCAAELTKAGFKDNARM